MSVDVAVLHDKFNTMGGAERVACEIARTFDCPIYTANDPGQTPADVETRRLFTDSRKLYWLATHAPGGTLFHALQWKYIDELAPYDVVITTSSRANWYTPHGEQTLLRYVHSPPRWCHDLWHKRQPGLKRAAVATVSQMLYEIRHSYPDTILANSEVVKDRINRYQDATTDIDVLYPPVQTSHTSPDLAPTEDYYLYIGRLAVNKRIDLLRDVAAEIDEKVVVAGTGPYKEELVADKPDNVEYLGYIAAEEKWRRLAEAKATFMLAESEDFGIAPIESMAAGTPVIGVREGFTKHQIKNGKNGYCCEPHVASVVEALSLLQDHGVAWGEQTIASYGDQFSTERFRDELRTHVETAHNDSETPNLKQPAQPRLND